MEMSLSTPEWMIWTVVVSHRTGSGGILRRHLPLSQAHPTQTFNEEI
jgi:hypothetical protein